MDSRLRGNDKERDNKKEGKIVRVKIFLILLFLIAVSSAQSVDDIVEEIQERYENLENLSAEFKQVEYFQLTGSKNETSGKIYVKNGTQYRLETEDRVIVTDGVTVWTYSMFNNQVLIDRVKKNDASVLPRDLLFKYPRDYYSALLKTEDYEDDEHYVLKLDPKEDTHGYVKSMKIWVNSDTYLISKIEYIDFNENTSTFAIQKVDINTVLKDSFFKFKVPEGVETVDLRM
jgi:chaperone LolA